MTLSPTPFDLTSPPSGFVLGSHARETAGVAGLNAALRAGALHKMWHNTYAVHRMPLEKHLQAADLTLGRRVVPCLDTAAALYEFDISDDTRLHFLAASDTTTNRKQWVTHRIEPVMPLSVVCGRELMDAAETAVRIAARHRSGQRALGVLDASLRSGAVATKEDLSNISATLRINGIRRIRAIVPWTSPLAESPRESALRYVVRTGGLPPPKLQHWVSVNSFLRYRLDLAWPEFKVGCEYDGLAFHTGAALAKDRRRLNDLQTAGWAIVSVTSQMLALQQDQILGQVLGLLRSRGFRP